MKIEQEGNTRHKVERKSFEKSSLLGIYSKYLNRNIKTRIMLLESTAVCFLLENVQNFLSSNHISFRKLDY